MKNNSIDINADVGEGIGNEAELMPYLSSCNIACGGHAGDTTSMRTVALLANANGVKIGAHPSFPDKENFGRLPMHISDTDLYDSLKTQTENLIAILNAENLKLHHIKPHGALYNLAAKEERFATVILDVITSFQFPLKLYAPYASVISKLAKDREIEVVFEAFADRNYNENLTLVSRQNHNALIIKKELVFEHVFNMISHKKVRTISGVDVALLADTICVHGDTENAVEILQYLQQKLIENNIQIF